MACNKSNENGGTSASINMFSVKLSFREEQLNGPTLSIISRGEKPLTLGFNVPEHIVHFQAREVNELESTTE